MGNLVVVAALAAAVSFVVRSMIKRKKNKKPLSCGGDCSKCKGCR